MIIIREDGHILSTLSGHSQKEVEELKGRIRTGSLHGYVSKDCLDAFIHGGRTFDDKPPNLVARDYQMRNHRALLCAGGFVGRCLGDEDDVVADESMNGISVKQVEQLSAASRVPPELFSVFARCFQREKASQISKLSMVCRYWATLYRPMQWQQVTFSSADRLYSFLAILKSTLKGFPSPVDLINFVTVEAINAPSQPWIHLIPLYLNRPLFHYRKPQFALTITLRSDYLPSFLGDHVYMSRTHTAIPKSLSYFNFQCQRLELTGIKFHTLASFLLFVRAFRQLEYLHCINIGWTNDPTPDSRLQLFKAYPYPPLKRCSLQPFRHTGYEAPDTPELYWVSALWCWIRRRSEEDRRYLLEDHETQVVMNITSLFQGFWRRKYIPNLEMTIRERRKRDSHDKPLAGEVDGFDVCFDIDRRSYSFVFTLTADSFLTVPSGAFVRPRDHYYALHLEHIAIVATTAG